MKKTTLLYEGKAKKVYATDEEDYVIQEFKDDATAFNGEKKGTIAGKGVINNRISSHFFRILGDHGVSNHFVRTLSDNSMLVHRLNIFPIEVVVRNIVAGSLDSRTGLSEGPVLRGRSGAEYDKAARLVDQ